jgi:hypothetical protein
MRPFEVHAYCTKDTPYEKEAEALVASAAEHEVNLTLHKVPSRGSWLANTGMKPEMILEWMVERPNPVVYVDCDAVFKGYPQFFEDVDGDIAVYHLEHHGGIKELLSGTIYFDNNVRTRALVREWIEYQQEYPHEWDQKGLAHVLEHTGLDIKVVELPGEYIKIFDKNHTEGPPVIVHNQASRRFKDAVKTETSFVAEQLPRELFGERLRVLSDDSVMLARKNERVEAYLDEHFVRVGHQRRWYPKNVGNHSVDELAPLFDGQYVYVVGKGPSLDKLSKATFSEHPDAPILAINEAIHRVEAVDPPNQIIAIQQDAGLKDTCQPNRAGSKILISMFSRHHYARFPETYPFVHARYGLVRTNLTVLCAIAISKYYGATGFGLCCFDACTNQELDYAKSIGYSPTRGGSPSRFLSHRRRIDEALGGMPVDWITPSST